MANKWWTLIAVCTGVFMLLLDITIVNVALPDIQRDLDASLSDLQWVIDSYALTLAALQLTAGSLAANVCGPRVWTKLFAPLVSTVRGVRSSSDHTSTRLPDEPTTHGQA